MMGLPATIPNTARPEKSLIISTFSTSSTIRSEASRNTPSMYISADCPLIDTATDSKPGCELFFDITNPGTRPVKASKRVIVG